MTIIEMMARAIEGQLKPFVILGDSVALEIARAARDALVEELTDEHMAEMVDAGAVWSESGGADVLWSVDMVRAALIAATEVDDE